MQQDVLSEKPRPGLCRCHREESERATYPIRAGYRATREWRRSGPCVGRYFQWTQPGSMRALPGAWIRLGASRGNALRRNRALHPLENGVGLLERRGGTGLLEFE